GAASILRAYPPIFITLKWAGAAYLTYVGVSMAVKAIRRARRRTAATSDHAATADVAAHEAQTVRPENEPLRPFRRAAVISLLNPKAILFFISFWVQFLDPTYAYPALSFLLLAGIVQVCSAIYLSMLI